MALKKKFGMCLANQWSLCMSSHWTISWYWNLARIEGFQDIPKSNVG
jgi:hypothetical protein